MSIYERIRKKISKIPKFVWVLLAILFVGIFLRTYNFHDWLQFKGDAFRDAILVSNVFNGDIQSLPLLGPRAGGTMLRLGPIFYDFQYISAFIFQSVSAPVLAYPDLFFSILTIPLLFFFSRRFFSPQWSLAITGMLAISFLAVEYGRFAWNPNSILFFTLIFSYAILRLYDTASEKPRPVLWAFIAGTALSIASQLHFSAFLGLPLLLILFVLINFKDSKKVLSYRVILVFLVSVLVINSPIFISEFFKSGENTRLFFSAISSKADSHGILQNIFQNMYMFAKYFVRIGLGLVEPDKKLIFIGGIFCGTGFLANIFLLRAEKNQLKRNFLQWTILLMVVYFVLYIPLAFKIDRPRFYLPFMVIPYIYAGYIIVFLRKTVAYPRIITILAIFGLSIILLGNLRATLGWFSELKNSEQTITSTGERNSKGRSFFLTWGHFERAAEVMNTTCNQQNTLYFSMAKNIAEYDHSIEYALIQRKKLQKNDNTLVNFQGNQIICYYYISFPSQMFPAFLIQEKHDTPVDIGNLLVTQFYLEGNALKEFNKKKVPVESVLEKRSIFEPEKITRYSRVYWGDVWNLIGQ